MDRLFLLRRVLQITVLTALPLLSLMGWVRLDVENGSLVLFGFRIWAHEATLVVLLVLLALALLAGLASLGGRAFCGWMCPQTALSELSSFIERQVRHTLRVASWPAKVVALVLGALTFLAMAAIGGLAIVTFFVPASAFSTVAGPPVNTSLLKGTTIATILVFVVVVLFRHLFCEWMCLFGWLQRLSAGSESLRISFDVSRSKSCTNCGACRSACFMKLEPRKRQLPPTCLNCTKCVSACNREMAAVGAEGLISLGFHPPSGGHQSFAGRLQAVANRRVALVVLFIVVAASALTVASAGRQPVQVVVRQTERLHLDGGDALAGAFDVAIFNNQSEPVTLDLDGKGLDESQAWFSPSHLTIAPQGWARSGLRISAQSEGLSPGKHTLTIIAVATGTDGHVKTAEGQVAFIVPPLKVGSRTYSGANLTAARPHSD